MMNFKTIATLLALILLLIDFPAYGQFNINGQILQRSEYLHGYGTLRTDEAPAFSIGQRSRLQFNLSENNLQLFMSVQDIRIWGSTPQMKLNDNFLSVHESWAKFNITNKVSVKAGRQELAYDEHRILGNVDWALQARAHDIIIFKFEDSAFSAHAALAFNQQEYRLFGNFYDIPGQYKIAQLLWLNNKINNFSFSGIFWNNGMQHKSVKPNGDSIESVKYTQTFGLSDFNYSKNKLTIKAYYHHQLGEDLLERKVNAFNVSTEVSYDFPLFSEKNHNLKITGGLEVLSGNSAFNREKNYSFNPLYGTNHRFNGYMDYFFLGGRNVNNYGLIDMYFKLKYNFSPTLFLSLNTHYFESYEKIYIPVSSHVADSYLGTELDFTFGYIITSSLSLQAGYSQMHAGPTMELIRGGNSDLLNHWAYLAVLYRPGSDLKFTGLKF